MRTQHTLPRLRRRDFNRAATGAAVLAGAFPRLLPSGAVAHAATYQAAPALLDAVEPSDHFGVNEAFRARKFGKLSGAGWTRWTVQWFNMQAKPGDLNEHYFRDEKGVSVLEQQVKDGMQVTAMVLGTPEWAAAMPGLKTGTSVPAGLSEPVFLGDKPNPANTWGAFMYQLALSTKGLINVFEIWNEVEIPATGSNAIYNTWAGSAADYYQLLKVANEAAKKANPAALIATSPYSYFKDKDAGEGKTLPWFEEFAAAVKANGADVFDIFALNLYRNPHDLWDRMFGGVQNAFDVADRVGFKKRLEDMGAAGKKIWLTEINAMPYDDEVPGWSPSARDDGFRIKMDEQASYVIQAYALALIAGYDKIFFQALQDDKYPVPDELWGLVRFQDDRDNGDPNRARPAFAAYQVAAKYLGDFEMAQLFVKLRSDGADPRANKPGLSMYASRYTWAVQAAVFQKGDRRVTVLWDNSGTPQSVSVNLAGSTVKVINKDGSESPAAPAGNKLTVSLNPASRHFSLFGGDPEGYYYVGGDPVLVVETGVPVPIVGPNVDGFVAA